MTDVPEQFDPEALPSLWQRVKALPWLAWRLVRWHALRGGWLPGYLRRHRSFDRRQLPEDRPIDILVLYADHFEPARKHGDAAAVEAVESWCSEYEELADRHRDADGRPVQHTWFYRYDYPNRGCLEALSASAFRGFGEVEFHLHHGYDTEESFARVLRQGLDWFSSAGAMLGAELEPRHSFGYVAGNCGLDNGAGDPAISGCDTELRVLREAGCYADFTFPSLGSPAQPRTINSIYYAAEDGQPKSYDTGTDVAVGRPPSGDLMMMQGPVGLNWWTRCFDDGSLEDTSPPHPLRLAGWLSAHVHVRRRPEWVFVKLQTHAMQNRRSFLSPAHDALLTAMENWWNRPPYRLHYVTAREAYNIAKAAEAGCQGNPDDYRDYLLPPPANRRIRCSRPWRLHSWSPRRVRMEILEAGETEVEFTQGALHSLRGRLRFLDLENLEGRGKARLRVAADGPVAVEPPALAPLLQPLRDRERLTAGA
jgi:hypothetical protein